MGNDIGGELYHPQLVELLETVWGEGWLSPGGPEELARLLDGRDLRGKSVLDIGCGAGGIDVELVGRYDAAYVTGIDVEDTVCATARARAEAAGFGDRIGIVKVAPGPLPFAPESFDVVFSKDSIVHIPDKRALMAEVRRVLKPGGWFIASDWLIGHDGPPSPEMAAYIAAEGLDFGMASPGRYAEAMSAEGFTAVETRSRNAWYREQARRELAMLRDPEFGRGAKGLAADFIAQNAGIWERMLPVLDSGEHCPTHLFAQKPMQDGAVKGYWVAHVSVDDPEVYEGYRRANAVAFAKYGAQFIVRGGEAEVREGEARPRTVVIEFPSFAAARACFDSPEYQAAKALRDPVSSADLVIVEGWRG